MFLRQELLGRWRPSCPGAKPFYGLTGSNWDGRFWALQVSAFTQHGLFISASRCDEGSIRWLAYGSTVDSNGRPARLRLNDQLSGRGGIWGDNPEVKTHPVNS